MDNLSYTVICKPYVDDRTGNVYMESACAIYTNGQRDDSDDTREKVTNGRMAYRVTINGSLYNNIIYVSPCMYFFPAGEKSKQGIKTAELRLTEKNPNILDSADMICWVGRAGNFNKEGKQYTVTYKNNDKAGTAQIIIKGIGNYTGTITSEFEIFDPEENK